MPTVRSLLALAAAAIAVGVAAGPAQAASCAPSATVSAAAASLPAGQAQSYTVGLCFDTAPDRYDVQVFSIRINADGEIVTQTPVSAVQTTSLDGLRAPVAATGAYTATSAGEYLVRVRYYAAGSYRPEMIGEATWSVTRTTTMPLGADSDTTPPVSAAAAPPAPSSTPAAADGVSDPMPQSQGGAEAAQLRLQARAPLQSVRAGAKATLLLVVSSSGDTAARNVTVCQHIPTATRYLKASRPATIQGAQACVALGTIPTAKFKTVRITVRVKHATRRAQITDTATAAAVNAAPAAADTQITVQPARAGR